MDFKRPCFNQLDNGVELVRTLFPSTDLPLFGEKYELTNTGNKPVTIEIPKVNISSTTDPAEGTEGSYTFHVQSLRKGQIHGIV